MGKIKFDFGSVITLIVIVVVSAIAIYLAMVGLKALGIYLLG